MKTILLPLNLDSNTMKLFEYALPMAVKLEATLVLLHVVRKQSYDNGTFAPDTGVHQRMVQEVRLILDQLSRRAISYGVRSKIIILDGNPVDTVLNTAKTHQVDMIILSHNEQNENSLSSRIQNLSSCPILTWQSDNSINRLIKSKPSTGLSCPV